jgi:hypothetical protein
MRCLWRDNRKLELSLGSPISVYRLSGHRDTQMTDHPKRPRDTNRNSMTQGSPPGAGLPFGASWLADGPV